MSTGCETAHFRADDADCLVAASLACPACLSSRVGWELEQRAYEPSARCRCRACGHRRTVHLSPEQALRLALHERRPLDPTPRPRELVRAFL
ncbi:MAG TPA: hypothetical protein VK387_06870 [Thermoleophilaceae bacterium]|nr:hypothetical protein [Thermoleophilaceae bacterium]